jgi:hypothetical protein
MSQDQLIFADAVERPAIAKINWRLTASSAGALFHPDKAPNLVKLNVFDFHVLYGGIQEPLAVLTDQQNQFAYGFAAEAGQALNASDAHTFQHQGQRHRGFLHRHPHIAEWAGFIHERRAAGGALVTLVSALVLAVLVAGFVLAAYDNHRGSFRFSPLPL